MKNAEGNLIKKVANERKKEELEELGYSVIAEKSDVSEKKDVPVEKEKAKSKKAPVKKASAKKDIPVD